ncbi:MAG: 4-(cytidine 5'-diphospho)-2-C-methyl-D-erythritol kinase [Candidatus Mcinerneyibacterium aminivorans]|jgi:4-diphosphocytidyl-2-C-methyl-D-erythritol kinase|uniref:4-diphosphocytidyl-2-C-methyl-D-erythritol kinase n=1 Tax=Candidatus Mcinerneyibacterium aminivorans TaxID=2703815 RepID=A0A5D0MF67_9BACT|nr:MAG: 4-(cytidine 5'-diphospho)-2-C-methyl-D-erythritol kinase [Candidatus Mcinerneyibacterium aminivorans]
MSECINAYAKINIFFEIKRKRSDGYHEIDSLMQTVSIHDKVYIKKRNDSRIKLEMDKNIVPKEKNIAVKIIKYYNDYFSLSEGYDIKIEKNIPVGAGLGGSSADGAAVLRGLEKINNFSFNDKFIKSVSELGADIPFLYRKGLARVGGIGEKIDMLPYKFKDYLLIGYPNKLISSRWAYKNSNFLLTDKRKDSSILLRCLKRRDFECVYQNLFNRFEQLVFDKYPQVKQLKEDFIKYGASAASMSGSGSSVFAVYDSRTKALEAMKELQSSWYWLELAEFEY